MLNSNEAFWFYREVSVFSVNMNLLLRDTFSFSELMAHIFQFVSQKGGQCLADLPEYLARCILQMACGLQLLSAPLILSEPIFV